MFQAMKTHNDTIEKIEVDEDCSIEQQSETSEDVSITGSELDEMDFQDISMLEKEGISSDDIAQLRRSGINTVKSMQMTMEKSLITNGFKPQKVKAIQEACCRITTSPMGFVTATEVSKQRKLIFKIPTGSSELDKLLGGGIEAMSITEVHGQNRSGKTQLAHTLCITTQIPIANKFAGGKVVYIDTEQTFRPKRLYEIAERFNLDANQVLENILYARALNSDHQYQLLELVETKLHAEPGVFKLIIIDSIIALFRVEYTGQTEMGTRQTKLALMMSKLKKISEEYNLAIYITNQVMSDFSVLFNMNNATKPVGGNILAHASTVRVCFKPGQDGLRKAQLIDAPDLEEDEIEFKITKGGVDDVPNVPN